jgi:predicted ABC-type ATPase
MDKRELLLAANAAIDAGDKDKAREYMSQFDALKASEVEAAPAEAETVDTDTEEGFDLSSMVDTVVEQVSEIPEAITRGVGSFIQETGESIEYLWDEQLNDPTSPRMIWEAYKATSPTVQLTKKAVDAIPDVGSIERVTEENEGLIKFTDENGTKLFGNPLGDEFVYLNPKETADLNVLNHAGLIDTSFILPTREDGQLDTVTGQMVAPLSQFFAGFVGFSKMLPKAQTVTGSLAKGYTAGVLSDSIGFDAHEERLSNLAIHYGFENSLTEYLAADPNDTIAEGKFKNAVEGALAGVVLQSAIEIVVAAAKGINYAIKSKVKANAGDEAGAEVDAEQTLLLTQKVEEEIPVKENPKMATEEGQEILDEDAAKAFDELQAKDETAQQLDEAENIPTEPVNFSELTLKDIGELSDDVVSKQADDLLDHPEIVAMRSVNETVETTLDQAGNGFDNAWMESRNWQGIVDELYGSGAAVKERKIIINVGLPASGKSRLADADAETTGSVIIDSDFAKEMLPEFDGGKGAGVVHAESKAINAHVLAKAIQNGDNIVLPIVGGSGKKLTNLVSEFKGYGYEVYIKYVDIPREVAITRNVKRIQRTGRFVDPKIIDKSHKNVVESFEKEKGRVNGYQRIDNTGETDQILEEGGETSYLSGNRGYDAGRDGQAAAGRQEEPQAEVDATLNVKPRVGNQEMPKTPEEMAQLNKGEREALGSLRTEGEPIKVITNAETYKKAEAFVRKLLKESSKNGEAELLKFVKELERLPTKVKDIDVRLATIQSVHDLVNKGYGVLLQSGAYKAGAAEALAKEQSFIKALVSISAQQAGGFSSVARALQLAKNKNPEFENLKYVWGDDLKLRMQDQAKAAADEATPQKKPDVTKTEAEIESKFIRKLYRGIRKTLNPAGLGDKLVEYGAANLLSHWTTMMVNIISPTFVKIIDDLTVMGTSTVPLTRALGQGIRLNKEKAFKELTQSQDQFLRGWYQMAGWVKYSKASMRAGYETFMSAKHTLDPEFKIKEEAEGAVDTVAIGNRDVDFRKMTWEEAGNLPLIDWVGNGIRLPYRGLGAGDALYKELNYRSIYDSIVREQFRREGKFTKADPETYEKMVDLEVNRGVRIWIKHNTGQALTAGERADLPKALWAIQRSRENTFTDRLGDMGQRFQQGMNDFPVARLFMDAWFIRTPINIFKFFPRKMPLVNMVSRRKKRMWDNGSQFDRDQFLFETAATTALFVYMYDFIRDKSVLKDKEGNVKTDANGNPIEIYTYQSTWSHLDLKQQQNLKLSGMSSHSYYNAENNTFESLIGMKEGAFYNTQRFDPADTLIMSFANLRDLEDSGKYDEWDELASGMWVSFLNLAQDKTFTRGMFNFADTITRPDRKWENYKEAKARSFTPKLLQYIGEDDVYREVHGFGDAVVASIPLVSPTLEPKFDRLGKPKVRPEGSISKYTMIETDNDVRTEFINLLGNIAEITPEEAFFSWHDPQFVVDGKTAFHRFNELYGTIEIDNMNLEQALEKLIKSKDYQDLATYSTVLPDGTYKGSRESAVLRVMNKFESKAKLQTAIERKDTGLFDVYNQSLINPKAAKDQRTLDQINTDVEDISNQAQDNKSNSEKVSDFLQSIQ